MPGGLGYTVTVDGVASTTIDGLICERVTRRLVGTDRSVTREVAGMEGAWRFPDKRGLRTITLDMAVVADSFPYVRRETLREVANWVDNPDYVQLIISDEPGVYNKAFLANEPDIEEWRELGTFQLEFMAQPYSFSIDTTEETLALSPSIPNTLAVTDKVPVYPVIELTANGGNLAGFQLEVNGRTLTHLDTVASAGTITISSLSFTVADGVNSDLNLEGTFNEAALIMLNTTGEFPILTEGTNDFLLTPEPGSSATSVTLDFYWRERFR